LLLISYIKSFQFFITIYIHKMDNDSPFANTNSLIVLYLEPYLNTFYKSYQNIITLNAMPDPLHYWFLLSLRPDFHRFTIRVRSLPILNAHSLYYAILTILPHHTLPKILTSLWAPTIFRLFFHIYDKMGIPLIPALPN